MSIKMGKQKRQRGLRKQLCNRGKGTAPLWGFPRGQKNSQSRTMTLEELTKTKIKKHALREEPHECCGLLVKNKNELKTVECRNVSEKPTQHFSIMPSDYLKACRQGDIKAVYHSHVSPNDKFSINDMMNSRSHKIDYVLYSTAKRSFSFFDHEVLS